MLRIQIIPSTIRKRETPTTRSPAGSVHSTLMNSGLTMFTINATANGSAVRMMADSLPSAESVRTSPNSFNRARRIALIGLRGAGKSTLGAMLGERLGVPFIELDQVIEREHGAPAATLFEVYGQGTFRRYERDALTRVICANPAAVIATAGGIVADETTFAQLLDQTYVVWLQASPTEHMRRVMEQGDFRPMAHNRDAMNDLVAILNARATDYAQAHAQLDTSAKSIDQSLNELGEIAVRLFKLGGPERAVKP